MRQFVFDLDATITKCESLPLIATHFHIEKEIAALTNATITGQVPFVESFIKRVHILGQLPVDQVAALLADIPIYEQLAAFIRTHQSQCAIATGNLDCWITPLTQKLGCQCCCSSAQVIDNRVAHIAHIVHKDKIVQQLKTAGGGREVVFIGDGDNDVEAMRLADVSIATGLTHEPAASVHAIADYVFYQERALCRQLSQLL